MDGLPSAAPEQGIFMSRIFAEAAARPNSRGGGKLGNRGGARREGTLITEKVKMGGAAV